MDKESPSERFECQGKGFEASNRKKRLTRKRSRLSSSRLGAPLYQARPLVEQEIASVLALTKPTPLVLVTGASGTGKTTLVRHVLHKLYVQSRDSFCFYHVLEAKFDQVRQGGLLDTETFNHARKINSTGDSSSSPLIKALQRTVQDALEQLPEDRRQTMVQEALNRTRDKGPTVHTSILALFPCLSPYLKDSNDNNSPLNKAVAYLGSPGTSTSRPEGMVRWHKTVLEFLSHLILLMYKYDGEITESINVEGSAPGGRQAAAVSTTPLMRMRCIFFLDDLQWADEESLQWIRSLMTMDQSNAQFQTSNTQNFLSCSVVGTCRGNEVQYQDELAKWLRALEDETSVHIHEIRLDQAKLQLSSESIHTLVELYLGFNDQNTSVRRIARYFESDAGGAHLFFLAEILQSLAETKREILRTRTDMQDDNDDEEENDEMLGQLLWERFQAMVGNVSPSATNKNASTDLVTEFFLRKMSGLSSSHVKILQTAACIGTEFEPEIVNLALGKKIDHVDDILLELESLRLVSRLDDESGMYRFQHDKVQQACLELISVVGGTTLESYCLKIGRRLWYELTQKDQVDAYCGLVTFLIGRGLKFVNKQEERTALAELFYYAGCKARASCSYISAERLFYTSCDLLPPRSWRDSYNLTLDVYNACSDIALLLGDFEAAFKNAQEILSNAHTNGDKVAAHMAQLYALGGSLKYKDAVNQTLTVLEHYKVHVPRRFVSIRAIYAYFSTAKRLRRFTPHAILSLPPMTDPDLIAAQHLIDLATVHSYIDTSPYCLLFAVKLVQMTLDYGISPNSCTGFAMLSIAAKSFMNRQSDAYNYGDLAVRLTRQMKHPAYLSRVYFFVYGLTNIYNKPMRESAELLSHAFQSGYAGGDIFFALNALSFELFLQYVASENLEHLYTRAAIHYSVMSSHHHDAVIWGHVAQMQILELLRSQDFSARELSGTHMIEEEIVSLARLRNVRLAEVVIMVFKLSYHFVMGNYDYASDLFLELHPKWTFLMSKYTYWHLLFAGTVSQLFLTDNTRRRRGLRRTRKNLRELQVAVTESSETNLSRYLIAQGQWFSAQGNHNIGLGKLEQAEFYANKERMLLEVGVARELRARIHYAWGNLSESQREMRAAVQTYQDWGAVAKVNKLHATWGELLQV